MKNLITFQIPKIHNLDNPFLMERLQFNLNNKTKPIGSLGRLEALAIQVGTVLQTELPELKQPQLVVFAGDHGLAIRGVSAYPRDATWQMVENFLAGGAAVSVLAQQNNIKLSVVDCGVMHDFAPRESLYIRKIAAGTADALSEPAMTAAQRDKALVNGLNLVVTLPGNTLLLGEMGIGNTSCASLLLARLMNIDIADCTGAGTGLDASGIARKTKILRQVLAKHESSQQPLDALAAMGGFEIATMVGAILQASSENRIIVVDGFIATSAVLVASLLEPLVLQRCVFAHHSGERGHTLMLNALKANPLLDLQMRLGEGSGAALVWPLLSSACAILRDMASFDSAAVSRSDNVI